MGKKRACRSKVSVASSSSCPAEVREEDSDEDVVFTPSATSRKRRKLASDSDSDGETNNVVKSEGEPSQSGHQTKTRKKNKIQPCLDSSDEENADVNIKTPKLERMKKLQQMSKNVQAKKGLYVSSDEEKISDESDDDDDLPMFQNEEELPDAALKSVETVNEDSNLEDFVVEDDVVEMENQSDDDDEETEAESTDSEETKPVKRSKRLKTRNVLKKKKMTKKDVESGEEEEEEEDEDDQYSYANPYKEMDEAFDKSDILDVLSKNTANDRKNAKLYKKEMGKYQFSVWSERNKAAKMSKKARFAINMDQVKTDRGFKAERNLDVKDDEFYDYVEKNMFGESIRIFPHTKRVSMYNVKCSLGGCSESFVAGETAVVGATKFNEFNLMFMKKTNRFGKESFYYICAKHLPDSGSDSEYSSGE